ncbi:MAG: hypothetical protein K9H84_05755 [Bacteroidales bacterium]|nr:hypothetical protein [Bacteroidales bacterium]
MFENNKEGDPVARVGDTYLYKSDLEGLITNSGIARDSIETVNNYINNWVKQQVVLQKAEENLMANQLDIEQKLEEYRRSLIVYRYETELIKQNLDTIVSNDEIKEYYEKHQEDFVLRDNIIKVLYVKVRKDAPNQRQLGSFLKSEEPADRQKLREFCERYAVNYFLNDDTWLFFNDLLKEIPIKTYNQENYLRNNRYVVEQDSVFKYYINIKGFRIKESTSPLAFEKDRIRDIIINQRKMKLVREMEEAVLREAHKNKKIEIYDKS